MALQVSITGEPGCGKTTVAKLVANGLGADYMSTGAIQRAIAEQRGMTTLELNHLAETDKSIDAQIDAHTKALGQSQRSVVIDSRLAWRFLHNSLKVFLVCPPSVAAERVFVQDRKDESYQSREQAVRDLIERHDSEKVRFAKYYGASLGNLRNYDLVIDTSVATPQVIADAICETAHKRKDLERFPRVLISPRSLIPTQAVTQIAPAALEPLRRHLEPERIAAGDFGMLEVCRAAGAWGIVDGHKRAALALGAQLKLVAANLRGQDDEVLWPGVTARSLLEEEVTWGRIGDWEKAFGFTFAAYPSLLDPV